jgi:hypothetical protein
MNLRNEHWISAVAAVVLVILGVVIFVGVQSTQGTHSASSFLNPMGRAEDRAAQSDLRNALTAEKTDYTDEQSYTSNIATLKGIESSLDWGGKLQVVVGHAMEPGDTVCMSEASQSGTMFSIADIAAGPDAGTYFGEVRCPPGAPASALSQWPPVWGVSQATGSGYVSNNSDRCRTEGQVFETALNAYRAQHQVWPTGYTAPAVASTLMNDQLLMSDQLHYSDRWTYNPTTHTVDTSGC